MEVCLFSQAASVRTIGNGFKLDQGRRKLDTRKKILMEKLVKHWSRLHRERVQSPSLKAFKRHIHVTLRHGLMLDFAVLA